MKKIFIILMFSFLLLPQVSQAALDQRCWEEKDCKKFREDFGSADALGGFYWAKDHPDAKASCHTDEKGMDLAGRKIGFCLPAGSTVTNISFGGRTEFSNIGDFIKFIYQYGFIVGSVVAVMVIIIGGVMYIFSGGNSDTVGQAKKRIYGALTGLVLMAVSYTLLNTINPYLVNLRLPSIWAINTAGIAPINCEVLTDGTKIALASIANTSSTIDIDQAQWFDITSSTITNCGNDYYVDKTGGQTCGGSECPQMAQTCYQQLRAEKKSCSPANIAGIVYSSSFLTNFVQSNALASVGSTLFAEGWEFSWITDDGDGDIEMHAVCKDGETKNISDNSNNPTNEQYKDEQNNKQEYFMNISPSKLNANHCDSGFKGYTLLLSINEEGNVNNDEHFLGIERATGLVVDLGDEDQTNMKEIFSKDNINQYLFKPEELKKGIRLDVDVANICDIDEDRDNYLCYNKWGLTKP